MRAAFWVDIWWKKKRKEDGYKFPLSLSPYFNAYKYLRPIRER